MLNLAIIRGSKHAIESNKSYASIVLLNQSQREISLDTILRKIYDMSRWIRKKEELMDFFFLVWISTLRLTNANSFHHAAIKNLYGPLFFYLNR